MPDMSRLKIGNKLVSASLAALREGDDVSRPHDLPEPSVTQAKRAPKLGTYLAFSVCNSLRQSRPCRLITFVCSTEASFLFADAMSTTSKSLLEAIANKATFSKDEALRALPNTSARRVDRILASLVKDGHLKKYVTKLYDALCIATQPDLLFLRPTIPIAPRG